MIFQGFNKNKKRDKTTVQNYLKVIWLIWKF